MQGLQALHAIRHYPVFPRAVPVRGARRPRAPRQSAALMGSKLPNPARLACLRRAASVRSEPGSNSPRLCPRPEGLEISSFGLNPSKIIVELIDRIRKSALSGGLSGFRDAETRAFGFLRLPPSLPFSSLPCLFQRAPPVFQSGKRESSAFRKNCQAKSALFLNFFLFFFAFFLLRRDDFARAAKGTSQGFKRGAP